MNYRIKPLQWHPVGDARIMQKAHIPILNDFVWVYKTDRWGCFFRFGSESAQPCLDIDEGKRAAEDLWRQRLEDCLLPILELG